MTKQQITRSVSAAEKRRRHERKRERQLAAAKGASPVMSPTERRCPADISPALLDCCLSEVRYQFRTGSKGVYGANIAKAAERMIGPLCPVHREFLVGWINLLARNRVEVASGRYSPKNATATITAMIAAANSAAIDVLSSSTSSPLTGADNSGVDAAQASNAASEARSATNPPVMLGGTAATARPRSGLSLDPERAHLLGPFDDSIQNIKDDHEAALRAAKASLDYEERLRRNAPIDDAVGDDDDHDDGSPQAALPLDEVKGAIYPAPFTFKFNRAGETKANAFFASIHFKESLNAVLNKANALAADADAVRGVIRRGTAEANYLRKAMADLGVDLP